MTESTPRSRETPIGMREVNSARIPLSRHQTFASHAGASGLVELPLKGEIPRHPELTSADHVSDRGMG